MNYSIIGRIFGKKIAANEKKRLAYAGVDIDEYNWIGFEIVFSALFAVMVLTVVYAFVNLQLALISAIASWVIVILLMEISLDLLSDVRRRFIEGILPDVLNVLSINLRGGLSIEDSLILSAKYEFGFFSKNLATTAKELHTGKSLREALKRLNENVRSETLNRVIYLILESSSTGGELAEVLDKISRSIVRVNNLNKEVDSSVLMYVWYIVLIAGIIAPFLFAIVYFLYGIMSSLTPDITFSSKIHPEFISTKLIEDFLIANLVIVGFSSGLLLGVIKRGDVKYGVKYSPILIALGLIVFFVTTMLFKIMFGAKLGNF